MSLNDSCELYIEVEISVKNSQLLTELKVYKNAEQRIRPNMFSRTAYYRKALDFESSEGVRDCTLFKRIYSAFSGMVIDDSRYPVPSALRLASNNNLSIPSEGEHFYQGMNVNFDTVHPELDDIQNFLDEEDFDAAEGSVNCTRTPSNEEPRPNTPAYLPQNLRQFSPVISQNSERFSIEPVANPEELQVETEVVQKKKKTKKVWSPVPPRDLRQRRNKTSLEGSSKTDTPRKTPKRKIRKPSTHNKRKRVRRSSERNTDNNDVPQDIDGTGENEEPAPTCEDSVFRSGMSPNEEAPRRHVPQNSRNSGSVPNNVGTAERISDMPETDMEVILQKKKKKTRKSWNPKPRTPKPRRTKTSLGGSSKLCLTTEPQRRKDMEIHTNVTSERNTGVRDASPQRTLEEGIDVIDENEGFAHLSHDPFDGISGPSGYLPQVADSSNSGSHSVQSFVASIQELDADKEAKKMVKVAIKSGKTPLTANAEALRHVLVQAKIAKQTTPLVQALVRARFLVYRHEPK